MPDSPRARAHESNPRQREWHTSTLILALLIDVVPRNIQSGGFGADSGPVGYFCCPAGSLFMLFSHKNMSKAAQTSLTMEGVTFGYSKKVFLLGPPHNNLVSFALPATSVEQQMQQMHFQKYKFIQS
jgi:hypothetical protein